VRRLASRRWRGGSRGIDPPDGEISEFDSPPPPPLRERRDSGALASSAEATRTHIEHAIERAPVRRRTGTALAVAFLALLALVGVAQMFVFGPGADCGLGTAQVYIVYETNGRGSDASDGRIAIQQAYGVEKNDTDRPFTIREVGPNQSEFNRSYAREAPLREEVKEGVPARSGGIDEDEAFYLFYGHGRSGVGATEDGEVFVLTAGIC
jgi:hypothetical protein